MLLCALCRQPLIYVHGHATCAAHGCPMYGQNQAECCSGETSENCPIVVVPQAPTGFVDRDRS
jgi:hypothetical protein